jgi:catechol 2,3-dioxygenase-like lactoylglutathione lyase family enzyme
MDRITGTTVTFISVANRDRALAFYRDTLGLTLRSSDPHGDFIELDNALLRLTAMADHKPNAHPVLGWNVEDIAAAAAGLRGRGVTLTIYEGMGQDDLGIWSSPDGKTKVAWFNDPDGNVLSLSQA